MILHVYGNSMIDRFFHRKIIKTNPCTKHCHGRLQLLLKIRLYSFLYFVCYACLCIVLHCLENCSLSSIIIRCYFTFVIIMMSNGQKVFSFPSITHTYFISSGISLHFNSIGNSYKCKSLTCVYIVYFSEHFEHLLKKHK